MSLRRLRPDSFTIALLGTVLLASLLPCRGQTARIFDGAIALLFFFCTAPSRHARRSYKA